MDEAKIQKTLKDYAFSQELHVNPGNTRLKVRHNRTICFKYDIVNSCLLFSEFSIHWERRGDI
jgi:hypothetical protein